MKRRSTTIDQTKLQPHWWSGWEAEIAGRRVRFRRSGRDWLARVGGLRGVFGRTIAGGPTLLQAVRAAKGTLS